MILPSSNLPLREVHIIFNFNVNTIDPGFVHFQIAHILKLHSFTISWTTPASSSSEVKGWLKNSAYLLTLTKGSFLMSSYFKNNARLVWYAFLSVPRLLVPTHFWPWRARVDATTLPSSTYWCLLDQQAKIRHNLAQSSRFLNYEPI